MDFLTSIKTCFNKYATFSGRASRSEFWFWVLFCFLAGIILGILDGAMFGGSASVQTVTTADGMVTTAQGAQAMTPLSWIFNLVTLLPYLAVTARRLHDTNRSGWWMLISLTIIGIIPLLIWYCTKGDDGENRFGSDPLAGRVA